MRSFKAVLFDLDGTLVDSGEAVAWCVNELLSRHGKERVPDERIKPLIGIGLIPLLDHFLDEPEKYVEEYRQLYLAGFQTRTKVNEDVDEVLKYLKAKKIKVGVVTNRHEMLAREIIRFFPFGKYVDVLVGYQDGRPLKPDPWIILEASGEIRTEPEDCLMVGDTEIDVETGKNAGCFTVLIDYKKTNKEAKADAIIYEMKDLFSLV